MDLEPQNISNLLTSYVKINQANECEKLIDKLQSLLSEELPQSTLDTYIINIFNANSGLLHFIEETHGLKDAASYQKARAAAFKLFYILINNFPENVAKYSSSISKTCLTICISFKTSSSEKEQALKILMLMLEKQFFGGDIDDIQQIYTKLFKFRTNVKGPTVEAKIIELFGVISRTFPIVVCDSADELFLFVLNRLQREVKNPKKSKLVIAGCFSMIQNLFVNYAYPAGSSQTIQVYQCVKAMADPTDQARKFANRDAIQLLQTHASLFIEQLFEDRNWWENILQKYLKLGLEEKKVGCSAFECFYKQLAAKLIENPENQYKDDIIQYRNYFTSTIEDTTKNNYEIRCAIRAIGIFSDVFKIYLEPNEMLKLFMSVVGKVEHDYVVTEPEYDKLSFLPLYIESIASLMESLDFITDNQILCFQKILILMVKTFPKLSQVYHELVTQVFMKTLYQIERCKKSRSNFIAIIVRQGVIWSCSHPFPLDSEETDDNETTQKISYKTYLPLWSGLLKALHSKKFHLKSNLERNTAEKFFDEFIITLLYLINKLNLEVKPKDVSTVSSNPATTYDVVQISDYEIYLNVVDFYQKLFREIDADLFKKWLHMFINQMIMKSLKQPFNSGFYKLLSSALKISDELNYFSERNRKDDIETCFDSLQAFIKNMLVKMKQFNGDLQIACLQLLLQAPCDLIADLLPLTVSAFLTLFTIGRSYFDLVHMGLQTLTRWKNNIPEENMNAFLKQIIPALDSYLRSRSLQNSKTKSLPKTRKTKQILNKVKILVETEPELFKLQKAILTFISQLNTELCYDFVHANSCIDPGASITSRHLKISLPYENYSLEIYLDGLLPRILELALYCSNRKIRMTTCELLHSIIILFLGTSRKMDVAKSSELDAVFEKLVNASLRLGCDLDEPIQKLFEPLLLSLIRWYTHALQARSKQTAILIEALMEGITQPTDPSLRDFCGRCVKELTIWTIKHMDIANDASNIKVLIERIMSYSLHCDPSKKLGAALIFNNIYTILREEDTLFNQYWLEILYALVMSLEITDLNRTENTYFLEQVNQALNHVQRGLVEKSGRFNKKDKQRRLPPHFKEGLLKDVANFLFEHTGSRNPHCRAKCMQLFCSVRPLIEKCDYCDCKLDCLHLPDAIEQFYQKDLLKKPDLNSFYTIFEWLHDFYRALDGHVFLVQNDFIGKIDVTTSKAFLSALKYFLNNIAGRDIKEILTQSTFTVTEKESFNSLKLKIILQVIDFVVNMLKANYLQGFWDDCLPNLVCNVVFKPQTLGIEVNDLNSSHKSLALNLLQIMKSSLPQNVIVHTESIITSYVISEQLAPANFKRNVPLKQRLLVKGIILLHESEFSRSINLRNIVEQVFDTLFEKNESQVKVVDISDDTFKKFYDVMLQLAFFTKAEREKLVVCFFNAAPVNVLNSYKTTTCGQYFFELFKTTVIANFLEDFDLFLDVALAQNNIEFTVEYVTEFLIYMDDNKSTITTTIIKNICEIILRNWPKFQSFFNKNFENLQQGLDFIKKLAYVVPFPVVLIGKSEYGIADWIIASLKREDLELPIEVVFNFRTQIYELFPCISGMFDEENSKLRDVLNFMQTSYYEKQTELIEQNIILSLKLLLDALKASRSQIILEGFSEIYSTTVYNTKSLQLDDALAFYINQLDSNSQLKSLEIIYNLSLNKNSLAGYKEANDILACLLQNCSKTTFEKFALTYMSNIVDFIKNPTATIKKIVAFLVIEILFFRIDFLNFEPVAGKLAQIVLKTEAENAESLIKLFAKQATQSTSDKPCDCRELFRLYQCQSYKALISVISNTKRDVKKYKLLFSREATWNCLVDPEKHYSFEPTFENAIPPYKNKFVNIRNEVRALKRSRGLHTASVRYSESQCLFTSTLSEDISKFDFSNTILRKDCEIKEEVEEVAQQGISLETIEINDHECMATVCGLIEFMVESGISPILNNALVESPPDWMMAILFILKSEHVFKNAKLLLAKIIHNTEQIFKPYSKVFLPVIVKLIIEECFGNGMNYFVYDLVTMLLEWSKLSLPTENADLCSQLLAFLMNNVDNDITAVYKLNRELIRSVLEIWKPLLTIPHQFLHERLKLSADSKQLASTIDLIHDILLNKLEAWDRAQIKEFLIALCRIFITNQNKSVYQEAAKAAGLALTLLESKKEYGKYTSDFVNMINKKMLNINAADRFLYCLEGLSASYPQIADTYLCRLVSDLNTIQGSFKNIILKILLLRCEQLQNVSEFSWLDYEKLLRGVDTDVQILTLELVRECLPFYDDSELFRILEIVVKVASNTNITCREIMYEILTKCLTKNEQIQNLSKSILIEGLSDQNSDIQDKVFSYCSNDDLSKNLQQRMLTLLNDYYKPSKEGNYLNCTVYLLFDPLKENEGYKSLIFDEPLHNCTFEEYKLQGNWRAQHASVVPMFAETLRSQMSQSSTINPINFNVVRATQQSLAFKPTQIEQKIESMDVDEEFKDPNKIQLSGKYKRSRYRFLKDTEKVSRSFALKEVKKATKREQARRDLAKEKERGVTFYRQYKRGDFPDVQIECKDLLLPLQILAKYDVEIAKTLFCLILQGLIQKLDDSRAFVENVTEATNKIFNTTFQYNPAVMGAFLEFAIEHQANIKFQPELIATVCQSSGLISTGIAIFEEYLLSDLDISEPAIKRIKSSESLENDCWIYLSELYKQMDEFDAVKGILLQKLNCPEDHLQAIEAETDGNWKEALEAYNNLILNDSESQYRKELYYESYFKCFASLSDWENLSKNIETSTDDQPWQKFWDQDWYQKKIMPWYLKSELKNILINPARTNNLMRALNECFKDSEKREYLETNFSEELAILCLLNNDEDKAKLFLRNNVLQFFEKWAGLNTLLSQSRFSRLLTMRNVSDIEVFIKELANLSQFTFEETVGNLKTLFLASVNDSVADLQVLETRVLYNQKFVNLTIEKLKKVINFDIELEGIASDLKRIQYRLNNTLIEAGLKQNNFYIARKYFQQQQKLVTILDFNLTLLTSKIAFLKAKSLDGARKSELLLECWGYLDPILSAPSLETELKILTYQHLFNITQQLAISSSDLNALRAKTADFNLLRTQDIALYGLQQLKQKADALCEDRDAVKLVAKAYVDIAYFAHKTDTDLTDTFIMAILRSMKLGSLEGVQLFPCILNTENLGTRYKDLFVSEAKDVPVWMFLRWIPQLLVNVDSEKIFAIADIIEKIALNYPQSIMYAYRLSKKNYSLENPNVETLRLIKKLDELLINNELVNLFLKALSCISVPANILRYYLDFLLGNKIETTSIDRVIQTIYNENPDSGDVTKFYGNAFKTIAEYKKHLERLKTEKNADTRRNQIKKLRVEISKMLNNRKQISLKLKDYCPWLANFRFVNLDVPLEIPGQYTGLQNPLPQYHVKIAGFQPKVLVISSLRKPIKVTILGNDAKEYSYLVKFGEDLRQDQRIEQLFYLMNDVFKNDYESSSHHFSIATYQVVPLTNNLGIIEWVENTEVLNSLIDKQLIQKNCKEAYIKALNNYQFFMKKTGKNSRNPYIQLQKCSRNEIVPNYQRSVNFFPDDLLRCALRYMSSNLESFIALKNNFIKSYAVMCVAHWFLGIGDRHLGNSMISLKNGEVIGIDFGHAFGTATQNLAIPELVPFRLTPCIVNVLQPLGENCLFKEIMIKTLKAFRRSSHPLLSTMEVFVKEPSLDWIRYAIAFEGVHHFTKVAQAKKKLEGINPVECVVQDLLVNSQLNDCINDYVRNARGDPEQDVRARKNNNISVEEQVECLLNLATDRNILGRMYEGYTSWI